MPKIVLQESKTYQASYSPTSALPTIHHKKYDLVFIFNCQGDDTQHLKKQRAISNLEIDHKTVITTLANLSDDHRTMLDLLSYPNPIGLHPNEARYRDFVRALLALPPSSTLTTSGRNHEKAGLD